MAVSIVEKKCPTCKIVKPSGEFYLDKRKKDGLYVSCKSCHAVRTSRYSRTPKGLINGRERQRKFRKKQSVRIAEKEYRRKMKDKVYARNAVSYAISYGRMKPAKECLCVMCKKQAIHYHHHNGYENRLSVIPLCKACHVKVHSPGFQLLGVIEYPMANTSNG